jgi:hypothetical protein
MPDPVPGEDKEAERAEKIRTSFAHTRGRKKRTPKKRTRKRSYRLPNARA